MHAFLRGVRESVVEPEVYDEMFALEQRHWWFRARRRIVLHLLARYAPRPGSQPARLADLGCGCGANLQSYNLSFRAWGMDAGLRAAAYSHRRLGDRVCVGRLPDHLPFRAATFEAVTMTDVLEHIDLDRAAAAAAMNLLVPGGVLVATVPAGQWLFTHRDVAHHHKRRYSRRSLVALFDPLPAEILLLSYCNALLFAPAAIGRLASRWARASRPTDLRVPPWPLNRALESVYAAERHLLGRFPVPYGLSLVVVARKSSEPPPPAHPGPVVA